MCGEDFLGVGVGLERSFARVAPLNVLVISQSCVDLREERGVVDAVRLAVHPLLIAGVLPEVHIAEVVGVGRYSAHMLLVQPLEQIYSILLPGFILLGAQPMLDPLSLSGLLVLLGAAQARVDLCEERGVVDAVRLLGHQFLKTRVLQVVHVTEFLRP